MRRVLLALGVAAALLILVAAPAFSAGAAPAIDTCQGDPPTPESPLAAGPLSAAMPKPDGVPVQGDPWNPADNTTILEQYGAAGMLWHTYDTGCGVGTEIEPNMWAGASNFLTLGPRFFTALTASVANWVLSPESWLPSLDGPADAVAGALTGSFANPLFPIALAVVAVGILVAAFKSRMSTAMTAVMFVLVGFGLLGLAMSGPSKIANSLDGVVAETVAEVMGADGQPGNLGAKALDPFWHAAIYDRWLEGNFGSATSATATKYGPQLFKAQALTWAEAVRVDGDAAATKALVEAKQAEWKRLAQLVKDEDPGAYAYLTGMRGADRAGTALIAGVVVAACLPFTAVALGMTAGGYVTLRFLAALLPVFAVLIIVFRGLGRTLLTIVGAVVVNTVVFAAGAAAVISISGRVFASNMAPLLEVLIVFLMSFVCWMMLRPFRTLTRMVSNPGAGMRGALEAPQDAVDAVKKFGAKAAATYTGVELADEDTPSGKPDPVAAEKASHASRPELHEDPEPAETPAAPAAASGADVETTTVPRAPATSSNGSVSHATPTPVSPPAYAPYAAVDAPPHPGAAPSAPTVDPSLDDEPAPTLEPVEPVGEQKFYNAVTKQTETRRFPPEDEQEAVS